MAFDRNQSTGPVVDLEKKTTKVNVSIIVGVLAFLLIALALGFWAWDRNGRNNAEPVPQERASKP